MTLFAIATGFFQKKTNGKRAHTQTQAKTAPNWYISSFEERTENSWIAEEVIKESASLARCRSIPILSTSNDNDDASESSRQANRLPDWFYFYYQRYYYCYYFYSFDLNLRSLPNWHPLFLVHFLSAVCWDLSIYVDAVFGTFHPRQLDFTLSVSCYCTNFAMRIVKVECALCVYLV